MKPGWRRGRTSGAGLSVARVETLLAAAVRGGILLLMLKPTTYYPFMVGKAVYARSVIEIVVGLWMVLALISPTYRSRRSVVLILLGAGVASAVASAFMGAESAAQYQVELRADAGRRRNRPLGGVCPGRRAPTRGLRWGRRQAAPWTSRWCAGGSAGLVRRLGAGTSAVAGFDNSMTRP